MKRKIITVAVICIIMVIPTIVAIISYTNAKKNPITENSVSSIRMSMPEGETVECLKTDKSSESKFIFKTFISMNKNADEVPGLSGDEYKSYNVTFTSHSTEYEYVYYFSQMSDDAYYRDNEGKYYKIDPKLAADFLVSKYALCLFPSSEQPKLLNDGITPILPKSMEWNYRGHDGEFLRSDVSTSDEKKFIDISGGINLVFDVQPDYFYLTLTDQLNRVVFSDQYDKLDTSVFTENIVLSAVIDAKWYQDSERTNYGEAKYEFTANVLSPAVFYLDTDTVEYGDFVVLSAKNIVNPNQIVFSSEPEIQFTPRFFEYGGYYHALIPFSLDLVNANKKASEYTFTLSYGGTNQELIVNTSVRSTTKAYIKISADKIANYRSEDALREYADSLKEAFAGSYDTFHWAQNNIVATLNSSVKYGFGAKMILENADYAYYTNDGVDYKVNKNQTVTSVMAGKVVFSGETRYSGYTIVIDHGAGLKTLYSHLGSIAQDISVGSNVSKGQTIGMVGDTGFCSGTSFHFGLYIFDVPVRPYKYSETGVRFNEAVAKEIGITYVNIDSDQ